MEELLNKLKELSNRYEVLSKTLGLDDDEEEYFPDCELAIDEGKSQVYWKVHIELNNLIKEYD